MRNEKRNNTKFQKTKGKGKPFVKKDSDQKGVTRDNSKYNDASWYIKEGQMAKDVASLSFNNALGTNITIEHELNGYVSRNNFTDALPGIFVINTVPSFGATYDRRSPINIAANNIVGFIRSYNSGAKNYDAPDLMLMLGAMDSVYALIAHLMRAYGTARVFSHTNRYIGDALLYSMGFNASEVRQNLSDFRAYINMLITKASAVCTPSIMSIYRRHFWMYSGVYKDEDIEKSQMYLYRPVTLWTYEENDGAGYLKANLCGATVVTAAGYIAPAPWSLYEWETFGDTMLNKLLVSQDIAVMSGDILKAYGEGNLWKLSLINEDYAVIPVYSDEVLDQIHNTSFTGSYITGGITPSSTSVSFDLTGLDVTQTTGADDPYLVFQPQFVNCNSLAYTRLCDIASENPDPERVIVATRNMVMAQPMVVGSGSSAKTVSSLSTSGSDIAISGGLVKYGTNGAVSMQHMFTQDVNTIQGAYTELWKFKRAPLIYTIANGTLIGIHGNVDNYTTVSFDDLRRMHESALLAMLGVPFYGLQTR